MKKFKDSVDDFFKWSISKNYKLEKILLCQATSPLLLKSEIDKTIGFIKKNKINSLFLLLLLFFDLK